MAQIGIIGGGISGLTLAFLLGSKGHDVRVFEASDQPGGAIRTTRDPKGWMAEWGPNTILESSDRIKRLITMLDLEDKRRYPNAEAKKRYIVRNQRMIAVPDSLSGLIRTPLLSKRAKWNLFMEPFVKRFRGSPSDPEKNESLAEFVRRRLGAEFLTWPIDALVGGIYAGDPAKLSVRHAFPRLALLEKQHGSLLLGQFKGGVRRPAGSDEIPRNKAQIFSFDDGLQVLPEKLSSSLGSSLSCNTAVRSISVSGLNAESRRWNITFDSQGHPPETCDVLIYAGTAHGINHITYPREMTTDLALLTEIPHPPVVSLTLGFRRSDVTHPLDGFGVLIPGVEQFPILGTLFPSSLFPGRAPDRDHVTLTTYLGGMRQPEIVEKSEPEQFRLVCDALSKLLEITGEPLFQHRIVWPKAIPQYHLGHQRILDAMDRIEQNQPGFYLAGNYRTGISVGDSINAAFSLADRIDEDVKRRIDTNINTQSRL